MCLDIGRAPITDISKPQRITEPIGRNSDRAVKRRWQAGTGLPRRRDDDHARVGRSATGAVKSITGTSLCGPETQIDYPRAEIHGDLDRGTEHLRRRLQSFAKYADGRHHRMGSSAQDQPRACGAMTYQIDVGASMQRIASRIEKRHAGDDARIGATAAPAAVDDGDQRAADLLRGRGFLWNGSPRGGGCTSRPAPSHALPGTDPAHRTASADTSDFRREPAGVVNPTPTPCPRRRCSVSKRCRDGASSVASTR